MPYRIVEENGKFCVRKESDDELIACHDTHEGAKAQIAAMMAEESTRSAQITEDAQEESEDEPATKAVWGARYVNNLPDSAFLYIEPGGEKDEEGKTVPRSKRHLPYRDANGEVDLPHLRNALSRLGQEATGEDWLTDDLRKRLVARARRILREATRSVDDEDLDVAEEPQVTKPQPRIRGRKDMSMNQMERCAHMMVDRMDPNGNVLPEGYSGPWWLVDMYMDYVIVSRGPEHNYRVPYSMTDDGTMTMASMDQWTPVTHEWVTKAVKVISQDEHTVTIGGYGVIFGGQDLEGEAFSRETDFWLKHFGPTRPVLYEHTFDPAVKSMVLGSVKLTEEEEGLWAEAQLDRHTAYMNAVRQLIDMGVLGWSSGAPVHMVRKEGKHITSWPIVELSLTPIPAEPRTLGVSEIKSLAEYAEALRAALPQEDAPKDVSASEQRAELEVETKSTPAYSEGQAPTVIIKQDKEQSDTGVFDMPLSKEELDALKSIFTEAVRDGMKDLSTGFTGTSEKIDGLLKHLEETPEAERAGFISNSGGTADQANKSFGDFLLAVRRKDFGRLATVYKSIKDMSEVDGTSGGFLVPPEHRTDLLAVAAETSPLVRLVKEIPVTVESGTWPALDQYVAPTVGVGNTAFAAGVVATAVAEGGALTETTPAFKEINWQVHKIGGYTEVPNELVNDSPQSIEVLLRMLFGIAVAAKREFYIIRGTGVGEPLGILNAPCAIPVTTNADNTFKYIDAMNMISRFKRITPNTRWILHPGVIPDFANSANWVMGDATMRLEDLGYGDKVFSEHMPQDDNDDVILADLGCYLMFVRQGLAVAYSEHAAFTTDKGTWRFTERLDGQPWLKGAITLADPQGSYTVSPFVYHDD